MPSSQTGGVASFSEAVADLGDTAGTGSAAVAFVELEIRHGGLWRLAWLVLEEMRQLALCMLSVLCAWPSYWSHVYGIGEEVVQCR